MKLNFSPLTIEQFLQDYWQQKPLLIKGGLKDFTDPLTPDELAGLAAEANIESRLISQRAGEWKVENGPFDNYDAYGEQDWTLVVQSVNHWIPEAQALARLFDFIPQWRFDDVMVSYAAAGGSVGPHVDNYDVFICQGTGQRRWKVGDNSAVNEVLAHEKLLHVEPFNPVIDEVMCAGDVLYIPPGFPHEGASLDASMSFSVGYKSTHSTELLSGFADYLIDFDKIPTLLTDQQRGVTQYGQIDPLDFERLQQLLINVVSDKQKFSDFLGVYQSQSTSELDLAIEDYSFAQWLSLFENMPLQKLYAVKMLYLEENVGQGIFYVDGERHQLDSSPALIRTLCDSACVNFDDISRQANSETVLHWLWQSTQRGYWYFE